MRALMTCDFPVPAIPLTYLVEWAIASHGIGDGQFPIRPRPLLEVAVLKSG
jgi:hypothetical protein